MTKFSRALLSATALSMLFFTAVPQGSAAELVVKIAPPAVRVEVAPPSPGVEFAWRPGNWRWNGSVHEWAAGEYVRRPHPGAEWAAGRWEDRDGGHVWHEGEWR